MSIQINLFGSLAEVVGKTQLNINDVNDTEALKQKMLDDFPKLKNYQFVIAVSKQIIKENQLLNAGDVVALLPPFAGG
ncbi:MAG: MoaD/ThiS family protein [Bacteroidetes bacterium]|nr:MoaD/ThiS family protein [Bacteroidota bacterium]